MARHAHPWYWAERRGWYVTKAGKRQFLGAHPEDAPRPKQTRGKWNVPESIRKRFHELMLEVAVPQVSVATKGMTVAELLDKYLDWCQRSRSPRTFEGYRWHLQKFVTALGRNAHLDANQLKPFHLIEWVDANAAWGPTYRRNAIAAVKRAYNWAEELGYVTYNPVRKVKKPMAKRQERYVSPANWEQIRSSYEESDPFRDLLEFVWETGCRPQEARHIEPRHVVLDRSVIAIPPEEAKGRRRWRMIRLEGRAMEVVRKRMPKAQVKLFENSDGQPWTSAAVNCRFGRLKAKLGTRFFVYGFRHGFANRLLLKGVDHLTVAELLGHADGTMLAKVYQHLGESDAHLREALRRGSTDTQVTET